MPGLLATTCRKLVSIAEAGRFSVAGS